MSSPVTRSRDSGSRDRSSYFGGKGGAGTYQRLINEIPPHDTLLIPFAGHCAITRHMRSPRTVLLFDLDSDVCDWWNRHLEVTPPNPGTQYSVTRACGIGVLRELLAAADTIPGVCGRLFVYLDPPYPRETLKSEPRYRCNMETSDHKAILKLIRDVPPSVAHIMISSYPNDMYQYALGAFRTFRFRVRTRRGMATEQVWCNYDPPDQLHDYQYHGIGKRERFKLLRRRENMVAKLRRLPARERNDLIAAVVSEFGVPAATLNSVDMAVDS